MLSPDEDGASANIHNHNSLRNDDDDNDDDNNNNHQQLRRNNVFNDEDHSNLRTFNLKNQIDQDILVKDEQDDCFDFLNNIAQETSSRHHVFDTANTNINHHNQNTHYIVTGNTTNNNNNNHNTQEKQQDWQHFFERQASQNQLSPNHHVSLHHGYVSPFDKRVTSELQPSTIIQMQILQQQQQMQQGQLEVLTAKWTADKANSNTGGYHPKQILRDSDNKHTETKNRVKKWSCSFDNNHNNNNNYNDVNEILDDINSSKRMNEPVESERKTISELQLQRDYYYLQPGQNGENITFKQEINADPQKIASNSKASAKLSQKNKPTTTINSHLKNSFQYNVYKQVKRWSVKVLSKLSRVRLRSMTPQHMLLIDDWAHAFNMQTLGGGYRQKSNERSRYHNSNENLISNKQYQQQQQMTLMNMLLPKTADSLNVVGSASEPLRQLRNSNVNSTSLSESGFFLSLQKRTNQQQQNQQKMQHTQQKSQQNSKSWWQCLKKRKQPNTMVQMNKSKYFVNSHQASSFNTPVAQPIQSVTIQSSYQSQQSQKEQIQVKQAKNNNKGGVFEKQQKQLSITKNHKQQKQAMELGISSSNRSNVNAVINPQDPYHPQPDGSVMSIYWNLATSIICSHGCVLPHDLTRIGLDLLSNGFLIGLFLIGTLGLVFGSPFELVIIQEDSSAAGDNSRSSEYPKSLIIVYLLSLILWSIDFFVSCSTGFYSEGKLIASIKQASHRYFFSASGICDCLSIFFLFWCLVYPSKIPQMLCLIRVVSLYWTLERLTLTCSLKITHRIGFRIGLILIMIGLLMHSAAIVWIAIGQAEKNNESSWMSKYNLEKEYNHNQIYASALYQMSSTLLFQGSPCFSWREQIFLVWVQIVSLVMLAIMINEFITIKIIYNQRHSQLPYPKVFELQAYMEYHRSSSTMSLSDRDIQSSMNAFPENIQKDLLWSINHQTVCNSTILYPFSSQTKGEIAKISKEQQFTANSVLYYQGEQHDDCLYIVVKGKVDLFYVTEKRCSEAENYLVFQTVRAGDHFGEYSFFTGMPRESYAKCTVDSVLFRINRNSFMLLLENCSKDKEYFCETRDDLMLNDQQQSSQIAPCITTTYCSVCQQPGHGVISCPSMHYVADKDRLLLVFSHSQFQVRRFVSSKRIRGKSNAWGDLSQIQNCANRIENNSSLYNKCANDAYNNNSSYYHQQEDTEQQILNDEQGNTQNQQQQYYTNNHNNTYNTNYYNNNHSTSNILTQNHPYASSSMNQNNKILSDSEENYEHEHHNDHMTNPNSYHNARRQTENSNVREEYTTTNRQFMSMDVFNSKHILPSIEREQQSTFKTQQHQQQLLDKEPKIADSFYHPSRKETIVLVNGENALHTAIQAQLQQQQQQQQLGGISPRQQLQVVDGNAVRDSPSAVSVVAGVLRNKKKNLTWNIEEDHNDKDGLSLSSHLNKQQFYGHTTTNGQQGAGTQGNTQHSDFAEASPNQHNYNTGNQNAQSISRLSQTPMTLNMLHNEESMCDCSPNQQQQQQQHSTYLPTQLPQQQSNPQHQAQSQAQTSQGTTEPQRIQTLENITGTPTKELTFSEQVQYPHSPLAESYTSITKFITSNNTSNNNHSTNNKNNNNNNNNGIVRHALSQSGSLVFANTLPNLNNNNSNNNYNDVLSEIKHQHTWKKTSSKYNTNNNNDSQLKEDTNSIHSASNFKKSIKKKKNLTIIQEQHQAHPKRRVHNNPLQQQFSPINYNSANNTPRSINNNNTPSNYNNTHSSNIPGFMNINGLMNYPSPTLKANNTSMMLMMNDQEHNMSLNVPMCSSSLSNNNYNNMNYYLTDQSKRHHTLQDGQQYYIDNTNNNNDLLSLTIDPSLLQSYEQQSDLNRMRQSRQSSASRLALQLPKLSQVLPHTANATAPFNQLLAAGRPPLYNNNSINRQLYHNPGQNNINTYTNSTIQQHLRQVGQSQSSPYHQQQHFHTQQQIQQYSPLCLPCNHSALNIFQQPQYCQYNQSSLLGGIQQYSPILAEGDDVLRKKFMLNKLLRQKSSLPEEGVIHAAGAAPNSNFSMIPTNFLIPSGSCLNNNSQSYISCLNAFLQPYSNNANNNKTNNNNNNNNNTSSFLPFQMEQQSPTHHSSDQLMNMNLLQNLNVLKNQYNINSNNNNNYIVFDSWQVMEYESMQSFEFYKPHNNSTFVLKQLVDNKTRGKKKRPYTGNSFYVYNKRIQNKSRRY